MLLQADFYFEDPEDQKRPDEIREGDGLDDMVQDARQLSTIIRRMPRWRGRQQREAPNGSTERFVGASGADITQGR